MKTTSPSNVDGMYLHLLEQYYQNLYLRDQPWIFYDTW